MSKNTSSFFFADKIPERPKQLNISNDWAEGFRFSPEEILESIKQQFPTSTEFIRELVQNSLDANASKIEISFNWGAGIGMISVLDNGEGMTSEELSRYLTTIFLSEKGPNCVGRIGIGKLSPIALESCAALRYTSAAKGERTELKILVPSMNGFIIKHDPDHPMFPNVAEGGTKVNVYLKISKEKFESDIIPDCLKAAWKYLRFIDRRYHKLTMKFGKNLEFGFNPRYNSVPPAFEKFSRGDKFPDTEIEIYDDFRCNLLDYVEREVFVSKRDYKGKKARYIGNVVVGVPNNGNDGVNVSTGYIPIADYLSMPWDCYNNSKNFKIDGLAIYIDSYAITTTFSRNTFILDSSARQILKNTLYDIVIPYLAERINVFNTSNHEKANFPGSLRKAIVSILYADELGYISLPRDYRKKFRSIPLLPSPYRGIYFSLEDLEKKNDTDLVVGLKHDISVDNVPRPVPKVVLLRPIPKVRELLKSRLDKKFHISEKSYFLEQAGDNEIEWVNAFFQRSKIADMFLSACRVYDINRTILNNPIAIKEDNCVYINVFHQNFIRAVSIAQKNPKPEVISILVHYLLVEVLDEVTSSKKDLYKLILEDLRYRSFKDTSFENF